MNGTFIQLLQDNASLLKSWTIATSLKHTNLDFASAIMLSAFALLFLTYGFLVISSKKPFIQNLYEIEEEEFDFMSTEESRHSQLDLAGAYIDMIQLDEAEKILEDLKTVVKKNPQLQQHHAIISQRLAKAYRGL